MLKFKYKAVDIDRKKHQGIFLAKSEKEMRTQLGELGLFLTDSKEITKKTAVSFFSLSSKVKPAEITAFSRQFAIMINASVSILDSINTLREQSYSALFKRVLSLIFEDIKAGMLLSEALQKHKKIFPAFYISMCYVGEMSGSLDMVLDKLAEYFENDNRMRRKAKSAMIYPAVLAVLTVSVLVVMLVYVIPMFRDVLGDFGIELPPLTLAIFDASEFLQENGGNMFLIAAGIFAVIFLIKRSRSGAIFFDKLKTKIPIYSGIVTSIASSRFARGFGVLLSSGMPVVDALEIIGKVLGNRYVENKFRNATEKVKKGISLSEAFASEKIFPPILIQMISVGEKTGTLDEVLNRTSNFFDEQVEVSISRMTSLISPLMMIIMGGVIAVVFISIYSPILSMMETIQ